MKSSPISGLSSDKFPLTKRTVLIFFVCRKTRFSQKHFLFAAKLASHKNIFCQTHFIEKMNSQKIRFLVIGDKTYCEMSSVLKYLKLCRNYHRGPINKRSICERVMVSDYATMGQVDALKEYLALTTDFCATHPQQGSIEDFNNLKDFMLSNVYIEILEILQMDANTVVQKYKNHQMFHVRKWNGTAVYQLTKNTGPAQPSQDPLPQHDPPPQDPPFPEQNPPLSLQLGAQTLFSGETLDSLENDCIDTGALQQDLLAIVTQISQNKDNTHDETIFHELKKMEQDDCELLDDIATFHNLTHQKLVFYHARTTERIRANRTLQKILHVHMKH
jgi:hypothetical protein